jgi:hypothetical protein
MNSEIVLQLSPEEQELRAKRHKLALLEAELAEHELFLTNLQRELSAFQGRYLREVGTLYAELDAWTARAAQLVAEQVGTTEARSTATKARAQAEESYAAAHGEAAKAPSFTPSPELKKLYRDVARRIHPDLATDDADRTQRERFMADANRAYLLGDIDALRRILEEYETSPESVRGVGVAADLVRVLRKIKRVQRRLAAIEIEVRELSESDIAKLRAKTDEAHSKGRDLLAEMANGIQVRIDAERHRFEELSAKRGTP